MADNKYDDYPKTEWFQSVIAIICGYAGANWRFALLEITLSISTAKNTKEDAIPTIMNSFRLNDCVLKIDCKKGI